MEAVVGTGQGTGRAGLRDGQATVALDKARVVSQIVAALGFAALVWILLATRALAIDVTVHDFYVTMDAIWRSTLGEVPHRDFHSPIGQGYYWPFMLLGHLGDASVVTLLHANVLVAGVLFAAAWVTLPGRLSPLGYLASVAVLLLTAVSPRDIGWQTNIILSYLAPYNRWGWSILILTTLIALIPRSVTTTHSRRLAYIDGAILGLCSAYLFFLKVHYFAGAIGVMTMAAAFGALSWRAAGAACIASLIVACATQMFGASIQEYVTDLIGVGHANQAHLIDHGKLKGHLREAAVYFAFIAGMLWALRPTISPREYAAWWWREIILAAVLTGGCAVLAMQNHPSSEGPLYVGACIVAWELGRRRTARLFMTPNLLVPLTVGIVLAAYPTLLDAIAIKNSRHASYDPSYCRLAVLNGGFAQELRFPAGALPESENDRGANGFCGHQEGSDTLLAQRDSARLAFEVARLKDTMPTLSKVVRPSDRIFALEFGNPYPALTGTRPPNGSLIWWDPDRSFSPDWYPDPARLLASSTIVLQGRNGPTDALTLSSNALLWRLYGPAISASFQPVGHTQYWTIWLKKTRQGGAGRPS